MRTAPLFMTRPEYAFTNLDKNFVRNRAEGWCEFPGNDCIDSNNTQVHHLTGAYVARLDNKEPEAVRNPITNALMLCRDHAQDLDDQEAYQVACLEFESKGRTLLEGKEYRLPDYTKGHHRGVKNTRHHRRRRK